MFDVHPVWLSQILGVDRLTVPLQQGIFYDVKAGIILQLSLLTLEESWGSVRYLMHCYDQREMTKESKKSKNSAPAEGINS